MNSPTAAELQHILRDTFGHAALRPGQREVIDSVLAGNDTLAIMPTGAGKSLCYQLPGLKLRGTTVIVSPLISLMKDQADKLEAHGIEAAALNSTLSEQAQQEALVEIRRRVTEMIFTTPERLADRQFVALLKSTPIDFVVIDEAHCVSQWGHDFRPAFLEIAAVLHELGDPTVLALTATATPEVAADIKAQLKRPSMRVVNVGVYRPNLHFFVRQVTNPEEKRTAVLAAARAQQGCGIVYCATVKAAEEVHAGLCAAGEQALLYHGKLGPRARTEAQDAFMAGAARIMVATNAFGMGIDKPDIRFVIHFQLPATLESYYQEAGRAGRDGADANCLLLYDHTDRRIQFFFMGGRYPDLDDVRVLHRAAHAVGGRRPTLSQLLQSELPIAKNKARVVFNLLKEAGLLARTEVDAGELEALVVGYRQRAENDRSKLERITFYAQSALCRWKLIVDYFGEPAPWDRCGRCDNCQREQSAAAATDVPGAVADPAPDAVASALPARWQVGQAVRVPKYGRGMVAALAGESVTVRFPNGESRDFLGAYVSAPGARRAPVTVTAAQ